MRKLLYVLTLGLAAAPAASEPGWSEFVPANRLERSYFLVDQGEYIRSFSRDDGYFHHGAGVRMRGGHTMFDYDRDYPYDYPSYATALADEEPHEMPEPSCTIERVRDGKSGWAAVRVCRN